MSYLIITIIILLGNFLRIYPRLRYPYSIVTDSYFHLAYSRILLNKGVLIPEKFSAILLPHENTYPFMYHLLLRIFSKYSLYFERYSSFIFDFLLLIVAMFFVQANIQYFGYTVTQYIFLVFLFYFTPLLFKATLGPRVYNGSPRVFGQFLFIVSFFSFFQYLNSNNYSYLILAVFFCSFQFVTAKFSVQVLVFYSVIFAFFEYKYLLLFLISILFSFLIWRKYLLKSFLGQIKHSMFYFKHSQHIVFKESGLKAFFEKTKKYIINLLGYTMQLFRGEKKIKDYFIWFFNEEYLFHNFILNYFPVLFFIYFSTYHFQEIYHNNFLKFVFLLGISGVICFILTSIKGLKFLGEAHRYLEYSNFSFIFIMWYFYKDNFIVLSFISIVFLINSYFSMLNYATRYGSGDEEYHEGKKIFDFLNSQKEIVIWPLGWHHWMSLYFNKESNKLLTFGVNVDMNLLSREEYDLVYGNYPYPSVYYKDIMHKYHVNYIFSHKIVFNNYINNILSSKERNDFESQLLLQLETENFILYKRIDDKNA